MKTRIKFTIGRTAVNTALLISLVSVTGTAQPRAASVTLPGHVPAVVASASAQPRDPQAANQPITLTVMLNLTDQAGFKAFEASLQDPTSPNYGHPVSGAELTQRFGPSPEAYNTVLAYLQQSGFTLVEGSNNRRTIMVRGTRAQAETAFQVSIVDYRLDSFSFHAPSQNPSLPAALAPLIAGVSGLSNAAQPRHAGISLAPIESSGVGIGYNGAITAAGSTNSGGLPPGLTGAGQTVGVIEFSSYAQSDLASTLATEGLSSHINQVTQYPVAGGAPVADCSFTSGCAATEALLDIAAVLGIAPGASVSVFIGPADSVLQVVNDAIDAVTNGGTTGGILSASLAVCEGNISPSDAVILDSLLEQYSLYGLTMFAATGDYGSTCLDGSGNSYANTIAFPSDLPHAVAVGGTILQVNVPGNTYASETWWSAPTPYAGGFGVSTIFTAEPAYQSKLYAGAGGRSVPDVAAYAFPGINICEGSSCETVSGTSLATPLWAGVWALLNQASSDSCGGFTSAAFNGYLYSFSGSGVFHSAGSMGSDFRHVGLGSPNITPLVSQLGCGPVTVTSINPSSGPGKGGTTVTVKGSNFIGVSKVKFGTADATNVTIYSDSKLTAESPAATADQVQVEVSVPSVTFDATGSNTFSYVPVITTVTPNLGPFYGGTPVTVTGLALSDKYTFNFGGNAATSVSCSSNGTSCTMLTPAVDTTIVCTGALLNPCTIPPPPGLVAVQAFGPLGDSPSANLFTYQPLTVSEFYPPAGPTTGSGVTVQIWGTSLKAGMTVHFGEVNATVSSCVGSETCVVTLPPAKLAGAVALSVTVDGVTASPTPDQFIYVVFPTITRITPNAIPANTGATAQTVTLTIAGTGFVSGSTSFIFEVLNGGALSNVACSSTGIQCTATITVPTGVTTIVTEPVAVTVGGYTSVDSVNLTFPLAPAKPPVCKGTTCN